MEDKIRKLRKNGAENNADEQNGRPEEVNPEDYIKKGAEGDANQESNSDGKTGHRTRKNKTKDVVKLGEAIYAIHEFIAFLTGVEELKITEKQAEALDSSITALESNFQTKIPKKAIAIIQLAIVASSIYIPKIVIIKNKIKENKNKENKKNEVSDA